MKVGDRVITPGINGVLGAGEEGVIVRAFQYSSYDWWVELPERPGGVPSTEMPFEECQLLLKEVS